MVDLMQGRIELSVSDLIHLKDILDVIGLTSRFVGRHSAANGVKFAKWLAEVT